MSYLVPNFGLIYETDDIFAPLVRCRGIEIGDGNFSGCAYGDGAADGSLGDDVCPACNNTGVA